MAHAALIEATALHCLAAGHNVVLEGILQREVHGFRMALLLVHRDPGTLVSQPESATP